MKRTWIHSALPATASFTIIAALLLSCTEMPEEPLYENPYDQLSENFEVRGIRLNQRDIGDSASVVEGVVQGKLKALMDQTTEPVEIRFLNVGHQLFTPENEKFHFTVQTDDEGIAVVRDVAQLDWTFKIEGGAVGQTYLEVELFREGGRIYQASSIPIEVFMGNMAPNTPSSPNPADNATGILTSPALNWTCTDPDEDPLTYDVYFGTATEPPLVSENQGETSYDPGTLDYNTTYYWKIIAQDNQDHSTDGPVWLFSTGSGVLNEQEFELGNTGVMVTMVWIPAGTFQMGAQDGEQDAEANEYPHHEVTISQGFWMGACEVTQAQWEAVTGSNPSNFIWINLPVEQVSWDDITNDFLPLINATETGDPWRVPTEAEWEYACRAGTTTRLYWGDDPSYSQIGNYAWYGNNSGSTTHFVGQKQPNGWGLYDMSGNLREWCSDWYGSYSSGSVTDPTGPTTGSARVFRGGSWFYGAEYCRSAYRYGSLPAYRYSYIGFRLVRVAP